jgi:hypothetical protein
MSGLILLEREKGEGFVEPTIVNRWLPAYYFTQRRPSLITGTLGVETVSALDRVFEREKRAFLEIKGRLIADPHYTGKYIAIVDGEIAGVGDDRIKLAREIYAKKGYVTMYIGEVSQQDSIAEEPSFEVL